MYLLYICCCAITHDIIDESLLIRFDVLIEELEKLDVIKEVMVTVPYASDPNELILHCNIYNAIGKMNVQRIADLCCTSMAIK